MVVAVAIAAVVLVTLGFMANRGAVSEGPAVDNAETVGGESATSSGGPSVENSAESPQAPTSPPASGGATNPPGNTTTTSTTTPPTTTTSTAPPPTTISGAAPITTHPTRTCEVVSLGANVDDQFSPKVVELPGDNPVSLALSVSERLYTCANDAIIASPVDLHSATVAAQLAVSQAAPLLYYLPGSRLEEDLTEELTRLDPRRVWLMAGVPDSLAPAGAEVIRLPAGLDDLMGWIEANLPTVGTGYSPASDNRSLHSLVMVGGGLRMFLAPVPSPGSKPSESLSMGPASRPVRSPRLWMVDPERPASGLVVAAVAVATGESVIYWDPAEEGVSSESGRTLADHADGMEEVWVVGGLTRPVRWLLEATLYGEELPGGGRILFPDRRLVAFYGGVKTGVLGVLGEQGPAATLERMTPLVEEYAADGVMTVPAFEIITTLATAQAGKDGDYSGEFLVETLMPWIEYAAQNDIYVVLDLQPGRSDFLSQAKQYEELLKLPHVGLALDPEWRLGPNEVHLVQIGSVDAGEVNRVIEWLAALVRRERLPQKLLIVHQFRLDMITDRHLLLTPPELAVMIHMDGQGGSGAKYHTWDTLVRGTEDRGWWWGWKNFFDEDDPTFEPEEVLELRPVVYFVSYQ